MSSITSALQSRSAWRVALAAAAFAVLFQGAASACDERIYGSCEGRSFHRQGTSWYGPDGPRQGARHQRAAHRKPAAEPAAVATDDTDVTAPVMAMTEPDQVKAAEPPSKAARPPAKPPAATQAPP